MKITLITTSLLVGGAEKQVCDLAIHFASHGHRVQLISLTGKSILTVCNENIELIELDAAKNPLGLLKAYIRARSVMAQFEPDVIHSHMVHANIFARLLKLSFPYVPLICTAHSTNEGGKLRTLAYRYSDWLCDLNTNVSAEAVKAYVEKGICRSDKIISMVNGIELDYFRFNSDSRQEKRAELNVKDDEFLLLAVGRLTEAKDYPNLLDAFSFLSKSDDLNVRLVIVGAGELDTQLKAKVALMGLGHRISFIGLRSDVQHLMSAADIFVMSSAWEGLPLVLLEAMACERLVVATDCGGIRNALNGAGMVVPIKNSRSLADAIIRYIELSPLERQKIGLSARQNVEKNYSLSAVADKWLSIYSSFIMV